MTPAQLLALVAALIGRAAPAAAGRAGLSLTPAQIELLVGALLGRRATATAGDSSAPPVPPLMSPIDNALGGETLTGTKTMLSVLAYALLSILQAVDVAGTATGPDATTTGQILTTLIAAFGGLGLTSKFDRLIQAIGMIAEKSQSAATDRSEILRNVLLQLPRDKVVVSDKAVPEAKPVGPVKTLVGRMSHFGGPDDRGVKPEEGLALLAPSDRPAFQDYFLAEQPPGTTGLARRLNPDAFYIACRWNYDETSKAYLKTIKVTVINPQTGQQAEAQPVDWGPNVRTNRIADLSPGLEIKLGLTT
jgi:hypothetical protein